MLFVSCDFVDILSHVKQNINLSHVLHPKQKILLVMNIPKRMEGQDATTVVGYLVIFSAHDMIATELNIVLLNKC